MQARFEALVAEREKRRPLQHLTGTQAFWHHDFRVTPDVLIPRPETELLVEASLEALLALANPRVADVGTGSGCIAISIAAERPDAEVHATDVSAPALRVARDNARRLQVAGRVAFHEGDLLGPLEGLAFDLIVSNPPYVDPSDRSQLMPEVRDHEPMLALLPPGGGAYGIYERLIPAARRALKPAGLLLLEVGQGMAGRVENLCLAEALKLEPGLHDLQGIPRVVRARR